MPDLRNFEIDLMATGKLAANPSSVTVGAQNTTIVCPNAATFDIPILRVQTELRDSHTGELLHDFRSGNAIRFALRVDGFDIGQHRELAERVASWLIHQRAGR